MSLLDTLNLAQREAVETTEGPVLIVAGAGAGKTKTLTTRIAYLIEKGTRPEQILAITFTNKAAKEMRERIGHMLTGTVGRPEVRTFHSFGVLLLREFAERLGRTRSFAILDDGDALSLIKDAIEESGLDPKKYEPKKIRNLISREKGNFKTVEEFRAKTDTEFENITLSVWEKYENKLKAQGAFDFDDLIVKSVALLREHADIRTLIQSRYAYVHIDEYQDTNGAQYALTKCLVSDKHNICVVGDTDQTIYSWRGAEIRHMLQFEKDFPNAKIFFLEENYRSTKTILEAANTIIKKNTVRIDKTLFTNGDVGEPITLYESYDENDEARFVVEGCVALIDGGARPSDIAVLYRTNFQSRILESVMLRYALPYQVLGTKFFERREVKDVLSYLRAAWNPESLTDIKRIINVPTRGLGKVTIVKLFAGERGTLPVATQIKITNFYQILTDIRSYGENHTLADTIRYTLDRTTLEQTLKNGDAEDQERLANIQELVSLASGYEHLAGADAVNKLLEDAALLGDQDELKDDTDGIRMMTVHASKGLEFKYVFIVGMEQDLFPSNRDRAEKEEDREEERRLFYVALTRAKEKLFLSYAVSRMIYGQREAHLPSEFLYDIPAHLVYNDAAHVMPNLNKPKIIYLD